MLNKRFFAEKRITKKTLFAIAVSAVVLCFAFGILFDVLGIKNGGSVLVTIPEGAGIKDTARILKDERVIKHPLVFRLAAKKTDILLQKGDHTLSPSMSYGEILKTLASTPEKSTDSIVKVLIPEGYELADIAAAFEKNGVLNSKDFLKEAECGDFDFDFLKDVKKGENRLEGYLFPATYEIKKGESAHSVICKMLEAFQSKIVPIYEVAETEYSLHEALTLASIIEREAANDSERGFVSSVFYNRMAADMPLSSCATVQYVLKERKKVLSVSDTKIKSPYNTYTKKGLPPGPIASPGTASFKAALYPEKSDYYYFAAKPEGGGSVFSKTGEEHMKNAENLK